MDASEIARWLLLAMPVSFALKTLAAGRVAWMLARQHATSDYGRYATWFFIALAGSGAGLAGMFARLAWTFHDASGLGSWLWWMVPVEATTTAVTVLGWLMVRAERRLP